MNTYSFPSVELWVSKAELQMMIHLIERQSIEPAPQSVAAKFLRYLRIMEERCAAEETV